MHTCPSWLIRGFPISLFQSLVEEGTHFSIILLPLIQKVAYGHFALYAPLVLHIQKRPWCGESESELQTLMNFSS